jgi:hypothetical protein
MRGSESGLYAARSAGRETICPWSVCRPAIEPLFVTLFLETHKTSPREIVLDLDATHDPLHGHHQRGSSTPRDQGAAKLIDLGFTVPAGSPADFEEFIVEETKKWGKVIRATKLRGSSGACRLK